MSSILGQYFLNHRLDSNEIEWQMAELAKAGYQGILAHARPGLLTPYMSEAWWEAMDQCLEMCRRTGMEFWIWDEDYFPSGLAGGRVVWENPGLVARYLDFPTARVEGEGPFEVDFSPGMLLRAFAIEPADGEARKTLHDLTRFCGTRRQTWSRSWIKHHAYSPLIDPISNPHWRSIMGDNRFALRWRPPRPGAYRIVGVVMRSLAGLYPDILNPESTRRFIELSYAPYFHRYEQEFGRRIRGAFTDEPSPGGPLFPWTPRFPEAFRADHGYELSDHLPHLALDLDDRTPAVRHHYRLTQHRLQSEAYPAQIARWCDDHGILATGHLSRTEWLSLTAGWWPNQLRCYQFMHIPAADPLGSSCGWADACSYHTGIKVVSSAAHLFGRAQASSDALAVVGDEASIRDLKFMLDYQMVLGLNHFSIHGLSTSLDGPRKDEVPPSIFYQHTEWRYMGVLLEHVRRTCEALTGGAHACGLALLYPSTSLACQLQAGADWYRCPGEVLANLPDETAIHRLVETLLSHQRDFDFIDEVTLRESIDGRGRLSTPEPYRIVLLPHLRYIDGRTADALLRFAHAGGQVLAIGFMPQAISTDLDSPVQAWADESIRFSEVLDEEALAQCPGLTVEGEGARDVFVLRRLVGRGRRTFVLNRREQPFDGLVDGEEVFLPPRGSVLLARTSRKKRPAGHAVRVRAAWLDFRSGGALDGFIDLSAGWTVTFERNHVPLHFWHVLPAEGPRLDAPIFSQPGIDLLARERDSAADGDGPIRYYLRFMLEGRIPDARLVMEDSTIAGDWRVYVNDVRVDGWKRARVFDCRNIEAPIDHLLRGGSTPALNVVTIEAAGQGRRLCEIPYLYGSFTCAYRFTHFSFPFLRGPAGPMLLDALLPWPAVGYPTFSGTATYRRGVSLAKGGVFALDLGRVEDVAEVRWDGHSLPPMAWPPYRCVLPRSTRGEHVLAIDVTNPPANRNRGARLTAGLLGPVLLLPSS
ncbi:MAG: hypothetical protein HYU36_06815 [Planctomycetes bacterium]|nr:hypothetical protein [Planctomycetota bacterium]